MKMKKPVQTYQNSIIPNIRGNAVMKMIKAGSDIPEVYYIQLSW